MRYEQAKAFDKIIEVVEKKEVNLEEIPQLIVQSLVKVVRFSTEPEL
jgi:hypothetical protein